MRRIYRNDMPQQQKDKIAMANTGKHHSEDTKRKISASMERYWQRLPYKPSTSTGATTGSTAATNI